jgi:histidyl-tRNA synthetase
MPSQEMRTRPLPRASLEPAARSAFANAPRFRFSPAMQLLPGFRDFYPDDCARRNYILETWRTVARRYGFVEFDGPVLEPIELYKKKSGGELVGQLFDFTDKGERHVAMRPEMTPTLARMVAARERDFKKPLKWFCVPQFFRYEKQQRGRLREFYQLNCDIIGEASPAADAEMIAVLIDMLRAFGLDKKDFVVRLSSRHVLAELFREKLETSDEDELRQFFDVLDKIDRTDEAKSNALLAKFDTSVAEVRSWLESMKERMLDSDSFTARPSVGAPASEMHELLHDHLKPRGLMEFVEVDFTIVRGLAYYTGVVFEVFDRSKNERALAGGGRYDKLLSLMSDGKTDLPALGFGMGDVVLANLINDTPAAKAQLDAWLARERAADVYVVIAKEERRPDALALVQRLRDAGQRTDFPLTAAKIGKQFQNAEQLGARIAVLVGDEWPQVKVKVLATREETLVAADSVLTFLQPSS